MLAICCFFAELILPLSSIYEHCFNRNFCTESANIIMPGECTPLPRHGQIIDRLKKRVEGLKHHSQVCQTRFATENNILSGAEQLNTNMLLQKAQEGSLKRQGKNKQDQMKAKSTEQPSLNVRKDQLELNKLKRKLESTNGMYNSGSLLDANSIFNRCDLGMPPSGGMSSLMNSHQYDFTNDFDNSKKIKMETEPQFRGSSSIPVGSGNVNKINGSNVSSLSVQIVQQFNNEPQQRIETTVNVNTNINPSNNSQGNSDSQSVSVNVGKDIKKEMASQSNSNQGNSQTNFANANLNQQDGQNSQQQQQQQQCENTLGEGFDDLESLLNELTGETTCKAETNWGFENNQAVQSSAQSSGTQDQSQHQQIINSNTSTEQHVKTEKSEFIGFNTTTSNQQHFYENSTNDNQTLSYDLKTESNMSVKTERLSSPYNNQATKQPNMQRSMNMPPPQQGANAASNAKMTSQHIHKLSVSVNSQFNLKNQQQQQQPQTTPQSPQQAMGLPTNNLSTTRNVNDVRPCSGVPPRLSHPSSGVQKPASPSPVSYSVSHQPHGNPNYIMPNGQRMPGVVHNTLSQNQSNAANLNLQRARMQMAQSPTSYTQKLPNIMQQTVPGMSGTHGMANTNISGTPIPTPRMSRAQQLKELANKSNTLPSGGMSAQWNANSSVNMSSNVSFSGSSINQQQHISADMQSYASFKNTAPNMSVPAQQQNNMQQNHKLNRANAAAQAALEASQRQHNGVYRSSRLSHYAIEENYSGNLSQNMMNAKQMYAKGGMPGQLQPMKNRFMQQTNTMTRPVHPSGDISSGPATGMPRGYGRQMEPTFPQGRIKSNNMMSNSAVGMRHNMAANSPNSQRMILVQQQQQRKMMMEQYTVNGIQKPGFMPGTNVPQRGKSAMSRPGMSHPQQQILPSHNIPTPNLSAPMPNNMSGATMYQGNGRMNSDIPSQGMAIQQNSVGPSWNRNTNGIPQPTINNSSKLPPYNINATSASMPGRVINSFPNVNNGTPTRAIIGNAMGAPNGTLQRATSLQNSANMGRGQMMGSMQSPQMHSQGSYPQSQSLPPSGMMTSNPGMHSPPNDRLPGRMVSMMGGSDDMLQSFNQPNSNSPNIEMNLNLINDFIDEN